jgi:hypothetical protein
LVECDLAVDAGTNLTVDLEEDAHCAEHDSADVNCSGETILLADNSVGIAELTPDPGADDQVLVSDSAVAATWRNVPDCDADNQTLAYDQTTNAFSCGDDDTAAGEGGFLGFALEGDVTCFAGTDYFGYGVPGDNCNGTENTVDITHAGPTMNIGMLKCTKVGADANCDGVVTIMQNGAASTASTCSFANTQFCAAATTTDSIASGDTWSLRLVDTNCTPTNIACTLTGTW